MKAAISSLLAASAITVAASAAPALLIKASIAEINAKGERKVLSKPNVIVESGKQATIKFGKLEYSLTPTLRDNGTVDIQTTMTERDGEKTTTLARPRMIVELGKEAEIASGQFVFTAQPSLAK